ADAERRRARGEVRAFRAGKWQLGGPARHARRPELARDEVGHLFRDRAIRGDLSADDRQHARDALAALVVEQRMLARDFALAHALDPDERADAGPGEVDLVER